MSSCVEKRCQEPVTTTGVDTSKTAVGGERGSTNTNVNVLQKTKQHGLSLSSTNEVDVEQISPERIKILVQNEEKRLAKNRIKARIARKRKKMKVSDRDRKIQEMTEENEKLQDENQELRQKLDALNKEYERFEKEQQALLLFNSNNNKKKDQQEDHHSDYNKGEAATPGAAGGKQLLNGTVSRPTQQKEPDLPPAKKSCHGPANQQHLVRTSTHAGAIVPSTHSHALSLKDMVGSSSNNSGPSIPPLEQRRPPTAPQGGMRQVFVEPTTGRVFVPVPQQQQKAVAEAAARRIENSLQQLHHHSQAAAAALDTSHMYFQGRGCDVVRSAVAAAAASSSSAEERNLLLSRLAAMQQHGLQQHLAASSPQDTSASFLSNYHVQRK